MAGEVEVEQTSVLGLGCALQECWLAPGQRAIRGMGMGEWWEMGWGVKVVAVVLSGDFHEEENKPRVEVKSGSEERERVYPPVTVKNGQDG